MIRHGAWTVVVGVEALTVLRDARVPPPSPRHPETKFLQALQRATEQEDAAALSASRTAYAALNGRSRDALATLVRKRLSASLASAPDTAWIRAIHAWAAVLRDDIAAALRRDVLQADPPPTDVFRLARAWLESGDQTPVPIDDGSMRADLFAARALTTVADEEACADQRAQRRAHWANALGRATTPAAWKRIAVRGRGTPASAQACGALAEHAWQEERFADAAAWWAERRCRAADEDATAHDVATWQLHEAMAWGRAGWEREARNLVAELLRWAPPGVRTRAGQPLHTVRKALQRRFAWHPLRGVRALDIWGDHQPGKDEVRAVEWLGMHGPGLAQWNDRVFLLRGYAPEIWSVSQGRAVAVLSVNQAWFGGSLLSVDPWVPGGGVLVASLVAGEPADGAGVQALDWVRSWAGEPTPHLDRFLRQIARAYPARTVGIDLRRHGATVLSEFRPGRRPPSHGRAANHAPVWVAPDGRALLKVRAGVLAVRPDGTFEPFWTWDGDGLVQRFEVIADRGYVIVRRWWDGDVVVCLDPRTGREQWRTPVNGRALAVEPTGSAVVVPTEAPRAVAVLDRWDGTARTTRRTLQPYGEAYPRHLGPRATASASCGRVAYVRQAEEGANLALLDAANGTLRWQGPPPEAQAALRLHVSAGAFVAVLESPESIRLVFPEPLRMPRTVVLADKALLTDQRHHGRLDANARLTVRGRRLFLERIPSRGALPIRPGVFELDEQALRDVAYVDGDQDAADVLTYRTDMPLLGGDRSADRYIVASEATFDGLLLFTARLGGLDDRVEAAWVYAEPIRWPGLLEDTNGSMSLHDSETRSGNRHAPCRCGNMLLVPTDRGARVLPIRTAAKK